MTFVDIFAHPSFYAAICGEYNPKRLKFWKEYEKWAQQMMEASRALFSSTTNLASTRSARLGMTKGEIDLRQTSFKDKTGLNLPLFVKLNGDISNLNSGESVEGSALVKLGNALFGINKTYTTQGKDFEKNSNHQEVSIVSTFMFGKTFTELNTGIVEAQNVKKANWSGFKQVATVGYDFDSGFSPFIQAYGRKLSNSKDRNQKEIGAFAGISYDISNEYANFFTHSTLFTLKTGAVSSIADKENNLRVENFLDINHAVKFQNGLSFHSNMQLSRSANALVKMSIGFSQ